MNSAFWSLLHKYENLTNEVKSNRTWLKFLGIFLIIVGLLSFFTITQSLLDISRICFFVAGLGYISQANRLWAHKELGYYLHVGSGLLYMWVAFLNLRAVESVLFVSIVALSYGVTAIFRIMVAYFNMSISRDWLITGLTGVNNVFSLVYLFAYIEVITLNLLFAVIAGDILLTGLSLFSLGYLSRRQIEKTMTGKDQLL